MTRLRRHLRTHQRLLLFLALALAVEMLRPSLHPVTHHHRGGDHPHTHLAAVGDAASAVHPRRADGLHAADAAGVHTHFFRAVELARLPLVPDLGPSLLLWSALTALAVSLAVRPIDRAHARAPPALLA